MAISAVCTIIEITSENGNNLAQNLRPVFSTLRVLGIDLDVGQPRSIIRRGIFLAIGVLLSVLVVLSNCIHMSSLKLAGLPTTVDLWCTLLQKGTRVVSSLLFQLAILSIVCFKWKPLWNELEEMGHFIEARGTDSKKPRRSSAWILATIITAVAFGLI